MPGNKLQKEKAVKRGPSSLSASRYDEIIHSVHRERPDVDVDMVRLMISVTEAGRRIDTAFSRLCERRFDIRASDARVLMALRRVGHPYARRPTDLFNALVVTSGAITKQVDRLVAKGLTERQPDPFHGGGFLVTLTAEGLKLSNRIYDAIATELQPVSLLSKMPARQREAGIRFCETLLREIESSPEP